MKQLKELMGRAWTQLQERPRATQRWGEESKGEQGEVWDLLQAHERNVG